MRQTTSLPRLPPAPTLFDSHKWSSCGSCCVSSARRLRSPRLQRSRLSALSKGGCRHLNHAPPPEQILQRSVFRGQRSVAAAASRVLGADEGMAIRHRHGTHYSYGTSSCRAGQRPNTKGNSRPRSRPGPRSASCIRTIDGTNVGTTNSCNVHPMPRGI